MALAALLNPDTQNAASGGGFMDMLSMTSPSGAMLKLGGEALGAVLGRPVSSSATSTGALDSSGWNISFGSGSITSSAQKTDAVNWMLIAGALIALAIVVRAWKH